MPNPLEKIASKGAAKVGAIHARAKGLTGVFNKLAEQHKEAAVLLERARSTDDPAKRKDVWQKVRAELLSHEQGELNVIYPELDKHAATRDIVQRHADEADTLETTIRQIDAAGFESQMWSSQIQQ